MPKRCEWVFGQSDAYIKYHDEEWGVPVHDDKKHFEFLILEGAQAGLSWSTVLRRRKGYSMAFAGFDVQEVSKFDEYRIEQLMADTGIIRNRLKIQSAIKNARAFIEIQKEFGSFDHYIWGFVDYQPIVNQWKQLKEVPATSQHSDTLSKDLKKRGFSFVGSTIMYAHMQACGLVNDHTTDCFRHQEIMKAY
jgi:DNA-3-methyladenine glycosylase I